MTNENLENSTESNFTDPAAFASTKLATLEIMSINKAELFSKDECNQILSTCIEELWLPSTVIGATEFHQSKRQKLRGDTAGFPFLNIRDITKNANSEIYDFNLIGIIDQDFPQVFAYSKNDFYKMHIELTPMAPSRKITFIINLSDPATYEGGNIKFLNIDTSEAAINDQGSCLIFPSYIPYEIDPVTSGTKHIIVGHVHGALFK
jgi:predicted 2-oxoglutarate/Fe(II)-dependent dioxygenase YbiX